MRKYLFRGKIVENGELAFGLPLTDAEFVYYMPYMECEK